MTAANISVFNKIRSYCYKHICQATYFLSFLAWLMLGYYSVVQFCAPLVYPLYFLLPSKEGLNSS